MKNTIKDVMRGFKRMLRPLRFLKTSKWHPNAHFYNTRFWDKAGHGLRALFGHSELSIIFESVMEFFDGQDFSSALKKNFYKASKKTDFGLIDSFFLFALGVPLAIVFLTVGTVVNGIGYLAMNKIMDDDISLNSTFAITLLSIPFQLLAWFGTVSLGLVGAALLATYIGIKFILTAVFSPFVLIGAGIAQTIAYFKGKQGREELKTLQFENIDNTEHPLDENTFKNLSSYNRCVFIFNPDSENDLVKEGYFEITHEDNDTVGFDIWLRANELRDHPEAAKILFKWDLLHINSEDESPLALREIDIIEVLYIKNGFDVDELKYQKPETTKQLHISRWLADKGIFHNDSDEFKAHLEEINPSNNLVQ